MYSMAHVLAYFLNGKGKWPDYIDWFLASAKANSTIDFYIFTDDRSLDKWAETPNINFVYMTFQECIDRIHEKIGEVNIQTTKKLCEMRPAWGRVFDDWLKGYDFWAFGDCDLILGDLRHTFTDEFLDQYEWFGVLGNLQVIRNTDEVNDYYKLKRPDWSPHKDRNWENMIKFRGNTAYDEWDGLPMAIRENGKRIYWNREHFANIYQEDKGYKKMIDNTVQENRLFQYWVWENGAVYHVDRLSGKKKERLYIHFSYRKMKSIPYTGQTKVYMTENSEFKESIKFSDTFAGWDFFKAYAKKTAAYISWHLKHPHGKDKTEG